MTGVQEVRLPQFHDKWLDGLQFCANAYEMLEQLRQLPGGVSKIRLRSDEDAKKLVEEILPICQWLHSNYRPGRSIKVCWRNGNQNYDSEILQSGPLVDHGFFTQKAYLEITGAYRDGGSASYQLRRLIDGGDPAPAKFRSGREFITDFSQDVLTEVRKKALKTYPSGCTLLVQCETRMLYMPDEWAELVDVVRVGLPVHKFEAIALCDPVTNVLTVL